MGRARSNSNLSSNESLTLGVAVTDDMDSERMVAYRAQYQQFRRGEAHGADGEQPSEDAALRPALEDEGDPHSSVSETAEREFNELLEWRLEYQRYRAGAAKGAHSGSRPGWTVETLRLLPVARLAAHRRARGRSAARDLRRADRARARSAERPGEADRPPPPPARAVHVHVGCGRLGLGLVVPALARGLLPRGGAIALLQRPSKSWHVDGRPLEDGASVDCKVNGDTVCGLTVVTDAGASKIPELLRGGARGLLVLSTSDEAVDGLAAAATTASCSLGPALASGLEPLLAGLERARRTPLKCFAAENDHDAVEKFAADARVARALDVVPLLVDRVCTGRDLRVDAGGYVLDTSTEPWRGEIVVMKSDEEEEEEDDDDDAAPLPFAGAGVFEPSSAAEAQFLHRRKILTVNGTHTTLAFLTLASREPPPHRGLPKGSYELVRAIAREEEEDGDSAPTFDDDDDDDDDVDEVYRQTWCFAVARQLLLLFESDLDVARAALGCDVDATGAKLDDRVAFGRVADALLENARAAIGRLGRGGDATSRVLGAGVVKRYEGRLLPVGKFLETAAESGRASWLSTKLPKLLLKKAKLSETTLRLTVLGLTADAARFCDGSEKAKPAAPPAPSSPKPTPKLNAPLAKSPSRMAVSCATLPALAR